MSSSSSPSSSQTGAADQGRSGGGGVTRGRRRRGPHRRHPHHPLLEMGETSSSSTAAAAASSSSIPAAASSSRRRSSVSSSTAAAAVVSYEGVWPEPFVEALCVQVALDASASLGRLAAAPSMALFFQVCSTWRTISRSELLWQTLTRRIWRRTRRLHETWRDEYIYRHLTARNFRVSHYTHSTLHFTDGAVPIAGNNGAGAENHLICLRIALSDIHLSAGFSDGSVRLFDLHSHHHLHTFRPFLRDRLGLFSRAVRGIILNHARLTFASLDGDIHVSQLNSGPGLGPGSTRRAHLGDVVIDGVLVDFTGCERFWVGLYAGVPGRAIHIWDAQSETLLFIGGTLTDPEAVMGWHMLTEWMPEPVGRVRVIGHELAIACTGSRVLVFDLRHQGLVVSEESHGGLLVGLLDTYHDVFIMGDARGVVSTRRVGTLEVVCRFGLRGAAANGVARGVTGCMNSGYALISDGGGVVRAWETERGEHLYSFRERIGEVSALAANDRHVAGSSRGDMTIHLWDFGA